MHKDMEMTGFPAHEDNIKWYNSLEWESGYVYKKKTTLKIIISIVLAILTLDIYLEGIIRNVWKGVCMQRVSITALIIWQPTLMFLPGESQGRGSLVGCHLWGRTESGTAEVT